MDNGYVSKAWFTTGRRSTGQRCPDKYSGRVLRPDSASTKVVFKSGNGGGEENPIRREERRNVGGGIQVSPERGDELVDGWPKWLTDNIHREALADLVPRSAESFDKLDKVSPF